MINYPFIPEGYDNTIRLLADLKTKPEKYWIKRGEERVLRLFHLMAKRVPAYKDFLKKNRVDVDKVKTIEDFKNVPTIDKNNYLRSYPLESLCWDGEFKKKRWVFSSTSGSTGEPFYFPRQDDQDWQYALTAELYLLSNFDIHKQSVIYIDGFAMGAWIGGLFTYQAIKLLSEHGNYKLSIVTPGIFKKEIIKAVKNLGHKFDKIIIGGYPPLIKDTIDDGIKEGLNWKEYNLGFVFSAEGFTEGFRDYIIEKTGLKNPYKDTLNHYGTVDLGTMSHETPVSIMIRRLLLKKENNTIIFPEEYRQPTLTQSLPELFFFEEDNNNLICSAFSGIPLVRYDLKDYGGVLTMSEVVNKLHESKIDLHEEVKKAQIEDALWNLPFVFVYERRDFIVKLYGANIYPDSIRRVLQSRKYENDLTGKFTMEIEFDKNNDQRLLINLELKQGVSTSEDLEKQIRGEIIQRLLQENSEYRSNYTQVPKKQIPKVVFWGYEHPRYFPCGGKQKWVKK